MNKQMRAYNAIVAANGDIERASGIADKFGLSRDYVANMIRLQAR